MHRHTNTAPLNTSRFLKLMVKRMWAQPVACSLVLLSTFVAVVSVVVMPLAYAALLDYVVPSRNLILLCMVLGGLVSLFLLDSVAKLIEDYCVAKLSAGVLDKLRCQLFKQFQTQAESFFQKHTVGDIMTRFTADLLALERVVLRTIPNGLRQLLSLAAGLTILFILDYQLAALAAILLTISTYASSQFRPIALNAGIDRRTRESDMNQKVQECLGLRQLIRSFSLESKRRKDFDVLQDELERKTTAMNFYGALVWRSTDLGVALTQILIMAAGTVMVFIDAMSVGHFVAFSSLLVGVNNGVSRLAGFTPELLRGQVSLQRIESILQQPSTTTCEQDAAPEFPRLNGQLTLQNITAGYTQESPVIEGMNLKVACGESVAIVGPSGAGKSTVLKMLMGLVQPSQGQILIDGINLHCSNSGSLRKQFAVVPQNSALFNSTIRENIRAGQLNASDREVEEAAKVAGIHEAILNLVDGYDTPVGERGERLSGGQRQRIAIARAVVRRPAVLLLDEATSALDPETEARLVDTLTDVRKSCTTIAVTHRLKSVVDFDRIVVVSGGKILEEGSHQSLLASNGTYADLWNRQNGQGQKTSPCKAAKKKRQGPKWKTSKLPVRMILDGGSAIINANAEG